MRTIRDPYERLLAAAVEVDGGCWEVQGMRSKNGYCRVSIGGRTGSYVYGHRVSYERNIGPIPDGMTVDHLCWNRACINPDHLRLLTLSENSGNTRIATSACCKKGHPYTEENLVRDGSGWRDCRTCRQERQREEHRKKREGALDLRRSRKESCAQGHPFDEENTYWYPIGSSSEGKRKCRACDREQHRMMS